MSDYYASSNDPAAVKNIAELYGFCLVKGVFTPAETAALERDLAMAHAEFGGRMPDLHSVPSLQWLLYDERIRGLARGLLGDTLVYYRETNLAYEKKPAALTLNPFTDYHCDARGTPAALFPPADHPEGVYPAYRFAIYFRNYRAHSGGLKVAPGSHLRAYYADRRWNEEEVLKEAPVVPMMIGGFTLNLPVQPMELHNVPSEPGDLVIFSLRCFHSAGALRLKERPTLAVLPNVERVLQEKLPDICTPTPAGSRNAIFFDFGAPRPEVDYYVKWRAHVNTANLDLAFSYRAPPPGDMVIRNDRIILALAQRIDDAGPAAQRQDLDDLHALCTTHTEFAAEHALFDRAAFLAQTAQDKVAATRALAREIIARRQAQFDAEKRRLATG